jgi:hypothetical protein
MEGRRQRIFVHPVSLLVLGAARLSPTISLSPETSVLTGLAGVYRWAVLANFGLFAAAGLAAVLAKLLRNLVTAQSNKRLAC